MSTGEGSLEGWLRAALELGPVLLATALVLGAAAGIALTLWVLHRQEDDRPPPGE